MWQVIRTYEDGRTRVETFSTSQAAEIVAHDCARMRYAGLTRVEIISPKGVTTYSSPIE